MSRTSALTRKPKGLGRQNFAQGYPRSHATPTPTSRSKGQKSRWGVGILWRPPSRTACLSCNVYPDGDLCLYVSVYVHRWLVSYNCMCVVYSSPWCALRGISRSCVKRVCHMSCCLTLPLLWSLKLTFFIV